MAIWIEEITLNDLAQRSKGTMAEHLKIEFIEIGDDYLVATMPVDYRTCQPLGLLNGGASCALAETVASTAANYCVEQKHYYCVGMEINANHVFSVKEGQVRAVASPLHLGKKTQVWQIKIMNEQAKLVCISRMTIAVITR